jgi:hypothetical protein
MQHGKLNYSGEMNLQIPASCSHLCDKVPVTASVLSGHKLHSVCDKRKFFNLLDPSIGNLCVPSIYT